MPSLGSSQNIVTSPRAGDSSPSGPTPNGSSIHFSRRNAMAQPPGQSLLSSSLLGGAGASSGKPAPHHHNKEGPLAVVVIETDYKYHEKKYSYVRDSVEHSHGDYFHRHPSSPSASFASPSGITSPSATVTSPGSVASPKSNSGSSTSTVKASPSDTSTAAKRLREHSFHVKLPTTSTHALLFPASNSESKEPADALFLVTYDKYLPDYFGILYYNKNTEEETSYFGRHAVQPNFGSTAASSRRGNAPKEGITESQLHNLYNQLTWLLAKGHSKTYITGSAASRIMERNVPSHPEFTTKYWFDDKVFEQYGTNTPSPPLSLRSDEAILRLEQFRPVHSKLSQLVRLFRSPDSLYLITKDHPQAKTVLYGTLFHSPLYTLPAFLGTYRAKESSTCTDAKSDLSEAKGQPHLQVLYELRRGPVPFSGRHQARGVHEFDHPPFAYNKSDFPAVCVVNTFLRSPKSSFNHVWEYHYQLRSGKLFVTHSYVYVNRDKEAARKREQMKRKMVDEAGLHSRRGSHATAGLLHSHIRQKLNSSLYKSQGESNTIHDRVSFAATDSPTAPRRASTASIAAQATLDHPTPENSEPNSHPVWYTPVTIECYEVSSQGFLGPAKANFRQAALTALMTNLTEHCESGFILTAWWFFLKYLETHRDVTWNNFTWRDAAAYVVAKTERQVLGNCYETVWSSVLSYIFILARLYTASAEVDVHTSGGDGVGFGFAEALYAQQLAVKKYLLGSFPTTHIPIYAPGLSSPPGDWPSCPPPTTSSRSPAGEPTSSPHPVMTVLEEARCDLSWMQAWKPLEKQKLPRWRAEKKNRHKHGAVLPGLYRLFSWKLHDTMKQRHLHFQDAAELQAYANSVAPPKRSPTSSPDDQRDSNVSSALYTVIHSADVPIQDASLVVGSASASTLDERGRFDKTNLVLNPSLFPTSSQDSDGTSGGTVSSRVSHPQHSPQTDAIRGADIGSSECENKDRTIWKAAQTVWQKYKNKAKQTRNREEDQEIRRRRYYHSTDRRAEVKKNPMAWNTAPRLSVSHSSGSSTPATGSPNHHITMDPHKP